MKKKVEIIAEIANAHQGDPEKAIALVEAAFKTGADAVKFQVYTVDELLVQKHPHFEHFKKLAFTNKTWRNILSKAAEGGRKVYCDVFGLKALEIISGKDIHGYKIHSSDLGNIPLIQALAATNKRILIGAGGSNVREINKAVNTLTSFRKKPNFVLMHGFQNYPTAIGDMCLSRLNWLREVFGKDCEIGYADHVAGDSPFAITLPLMAVAMGAAVLEKHITLDRSARGIDYHSSLNPAEFAGLVEKLRIAEGALGEKPEILSPAEQKYRKQVKKYWVTARPLKAGTSLKEDDITMKRIINSDAHYIEMDKMAGHTLLCNCPEEHLLTRKDLSHTVWALVVARMRSNRLPGKALLDVGGTPALQHLFERLKQARSINKILFCTTEEADDDALVKLAVDSGIEYFRGPTEDVLSRMIGGIEGHDVDVVLRVTGDDILVDPDYVDRAVRHHLSLNAEYSELKALPEGTEVEVFDAATLKDIQKIAKDKNGTEYLTRYIIDHSGQFRTSTVPVDRPHARSWRLTLDTPEDYKVIKTFLDAMRDRGKAITYRLDDIVGFFTRHPEVLEINSQVTQREAPAGFSTDLDWRRS